MVRRMGTWISFHCWVLPSDALSIPEQDRTLLRAEGHCMGHCHTPALPGGNGVESRRLYNPQRKRNFRMLSRCQCVLSAQLMTRTWRAAGTSHICRSAHGRDLTTSAPAVLPGPTGTARHSSRLRSVPFPLNAVLWAVDPAVCPQHRSDALDSIGITQPPVQETRWERRERSVNQKERQKGKRRSSEGEKAAGSPGPRHSPACPAPPRRAPRGPALT